MRVLSHVHCSRHRRGLSRRLRACEYELLDSRNLFTIVVFFENQELRLHVFNELSAFGTFELGEQFFWLLLLVKNLIKVMDSLVGY